MESFPIAGRGIVLVLLALPVARLGAADSSSPIVEPVDFLKTVIGFKEDKLSAVARGEVVTEQLQAADKPESVAFGVVRLSVTPEVFKRKAGDVPGFRKLAETQQIGAFRNPPRIEDLDSLTVPDGDLEDIQKCKQGDCDVMLSSELNARFKSEVDWSKPEAKAKAVGIIKEAMVAYLQGYLASGTSAMAVLNDRVPATRLSDEFHTILDRSPYLIEYIPDFFRYVQDFPTGTLDGAQDLFYWAKESFGLKPVITINHVTVYSERGQDKARVFVSTKELYASHYFRTALRVDVAIPGRDAGGRGVLYLMSVDRARVNPPGGIAGGVLLGKVRGAIEKGVSLKLKAMKSALDAPS